MQRPSPFPVRHRFTVHQQRNRTARQLHSQRRRLQLGCASMRGLSSKWMALKGNASCGWPSEDPGTTNWPADLLLRISNCPLLKSLQKARSAPSTCKTLQDKEYQFQEPRQWETLWVLTETAVCEQLNSAWSLPSSSQIVQRDQRRSDFWLPGV